MTRCLDPGVIFDAVAKLFGADMGAEYEHSDENTDRRVATQFAFLHRRATAVVGSERARGTIRCFPVAAALHIPSTFNRTAPTG